MTDDSAAGPKTEKGDRVERVAAGLEKNFNDCSHVLRDVMGTCTDNGVYRPNDLKDLAAYLKISAQIAGQIGRLETIQNRNSKAQ
jgi:hypothetical protein